jgi:hypothetical protein
MNCQCPNCGFDPRLPAALERVRLMRNPWGNGPAPYLSGGFADLLELELAGYATRNAAGWWIPTAVYPRL